MVTLWSTVSWREDHQFESDCDDHSKYHADGIYRNEEKLEERTTLEKTVLEWTMKKDSSFVVFMDELKAVRSTLMFCSVCRTLTPHSWFHFDTSSGQIFNVLQYVYVSHFAFELPSSYTE